MTKEEKIEGFTEEQKKEIANTALTQASKLLISACVLIKAENFIHGAVEFPDGEIWDLTFKKRIES